MANGISRGALFALLAPGPVLLSALRRLASICLSDVMAARQLNWVRFVIGIRCGGLRSAGGLIDCLLQLGTGASTFVPAGLAGDWDRVGLGPKFVGNAHRLDAELRPPSHFIAGPMQVAMMGATERHRELIADLEAKASAAARSAGDGRPTAGGRKSRRPARRQTGGDVCRAAAAFSASRRNLQIQALVLSAGQAAATEPAGLDLSCRRRRGIRFRAVGSCLRRLEQLRQSHPQSERA